MIHIFHGFLGSPVDFNFLKGEDILIHDIYAMKEFPALSPEDSLIGYSMGGRIALDIASSVNFQIKKLVLINSHPGLATEEERKAREGFELNILKELKLRPLKDFISYWNDLAIFAADAPIALQDEKRYQDSAEIFERYRLSKQKYHLPEVIRHQEKVLWIIGLLDEKYLEMAQDLLLPQGIRVKYMEGGHRLFQHPAMLHQILQEENIL